MRARKQARTVGVFVASVLTVVAACRFDPPRPAGPWSSIEVDHYARNRCAQGERSCSSDADCPEGPCVSVLESSHGALGRDGGHTIAVDGRVLWLFGDSVVGDTMVSNTAAWGDTTDPRSLRDVVDGRAMPTQIIPFRGDEVLFNTQHAHPPSCCFAHQGCAETSPYCHCPRATDCRARVALWPGDGVATADGGATFFYERYLVGTAPYDFVPAGMGVATLRPGEATAERSPHWLFDGSEPTFSRGFVVEEAGRRIFYAYATTHRQGCAVDILCARADAAALEQRGSYRFWDGVDWNVDLGAAQPIARGISGGLGSVTWNDHLHAYMSVWSDICTGGDQLALRTAPAPQGPWSAATRIDIQTLGARPDAYYGLAHPAYGRGRDLIISYFQPRGSALGQLRLLHMRLP